MKIIYSVLFMVLLSACSASYATMNQPSGSSTMVPSGSSTPSITVTVTSLVAVIAEQSLYIRNQPSYSSPVVGYLLHGEKVTVYECVGVWARIGSKRWVNSLYLSKSECQ